MGFRAWTAVTIALATGSAGPSFCFAPALATAASRSLYETTFDTHVILWWLTDDAALSDEMKTRLDDEPDVYVSPASLWEVTIKQSIGKLSEPIDLAEEIGNSGFRELPITFRHAIVAGRLPLIHRDPFDRMLVAQAQCEAMTLASREPHIQRYDVALLRV